MNDFLHSYYLFHLRRAPATCRDMCLWRSAGYKLKYPFFSPKLLFLSKKLNLKNFVTLDSVFYYQIKAKNAARKEGKPDWRGRRREVEGKQRVGGGESWGIDPVGGNEFIHTFFQVPEGRDWNVLCWICACRPRGTWACWLSGGARWRWGNRDLRSRCKLRGKEAKAKEKATQRLDLDFS